MRKILAIIMSLVVMTSLVACGGDVQFNGTYKADLSAVDPEVFFAEFDGAEDLEDVAEVFSKEDTIDMYKTVVEAFKLELNADNTYRYYVSLEDYKNAMQSFQETLFDNIKSLGMESYAEIAGLSVEDLQNTLDVSGMTFEQLIDAASDETVKEIEEKTDDELVESIGGELVDGNVVIEKGTWTSEGGTLTITTNDGEIAKLGYDGDASSFTITSVTTENSDSDINVVAIENLKYSK